jgi:hypothetical protein
MALIDLGIRVGAPLLLGAVLAYDKVLPERSAAANKEPSLWPSIATGPHGTLLFAGGGTW